MKGDRGYDAFPSAAKLFGFLKDAGLKTGGGAISRIVSPSEVSRLNLQEELELALSNFAALLERCEPSAWDAEVREAQSGSRKSCEA